MLISGKLHRWFPIQFHLDISINFVFFPISHVDTIESKASEKVEGEEKLFHDLARQLFFRYGWEVEKS